MSPSTSPPGGEGGLIHKNLKTNPNSPGGKWESKGTTVTQNPFGNLDEPFPSHKAYLSGRSVCRLRMASHRYPQSPFLSHGTYKHAAGAAGGPDGPTQPCGPPPITAQSASDLPSITCPNPSFSPDSCAISCLFIPHLNNLLIHFCAKQFQNCFPGDTSRISLWRVYVHQRDRVGSGPYLGTMAGSSWIQSSWPLTW